MKSTRHLVSSRLPTVYGGFIMEAFDSGKEEQPHLVLKNIGEVDKLDFVNVRIHSECITGDLFGSTRCDCGEQLAASMKYIERNGGVLIYLRQEGRGIGLVNKLKAYNLQDEGMDTVESNLALGFHADERDFNVAIEILDFLGVKRIKLLTNNPDKMKVFNNTGIDVLERIPLMIEAREENRQYLFTKKNSLGHHLDQL
jgi:GTP cyclohydrolase II